MKSIAFYLAKRYLLAKKGSQAVSFITALATTAMMIAVASMFIIISVFAGLEELNETIIQDINPDINIKSAKAKVLPDLQNLISQLKSEKEILAFSKIIEEKVYISYGDLGEIAYLRGVDSAYTEINPIHKKIIFGSYPSFKFTNEIAMDVLLNNRLQIPINNVDFATLLMPKAGKGIVQSQEDIFIKSPVYVTGVFPGNEQLNNCIFAPIELTQQLLNLPKSSVYKIVIKLKNPKDALAVKTDLENKLGKNYIIKTKLEENAAFWKMINTEKLMIYLIFALVIFITTFNLAGAIIIIQLDKKEQAKSLISLGMRSKDLRKTYFFTGILVVIFGVLLGLGLGSFVCLLQQHFGLIMANESMAFPIKLLPINFIYVSATALFFGFLVSWVFSKIRN